MSVSVNANISSADLATQTTGTKTITKPTGTVSSDQLVLAWGVFEGSGTDTLSTPTGWTLQANVDAGNVRLWVFTAPGSVAALGFTFTGSSTDLGWVCVGFTGVDSVTPVDAAGTSSTSSGSTTVTANAVPIATLNAIEVICGCDVNDGAMSATGFTTKDNGSTLHMRPAILYNLTGKAVGSTGTVVVTDAATATSQQLAVFPFALRPDAAGAAAADTNFGFRVRVPNNRVGPMALRQLYRSPAYPFDSTVIPGTITNRLRRFICAGA